MLELRMKHFTTLALSAAALLTATSTYAQVGGPRMQMAQDIGFYVGAGIGSSKGKDACNTTGVAFVGTCDDKDKTWNVYGGYKFHPNIGVEVGYLNLGETSASGTVGGAAFTGTEEVKGFEVLAVGSWRIYQNLSAYAKAGFFRWDSDTNTNFASMGKNGTDFTFGVGLQYNFTRNIAVRGEYQRYNDVNETDYNVLRATVHYAFY